MDKDLRSRQEVRDLAEKAQEAFQILGTMDQEHLDRIVKALRDCAMEHGRELGAMAVSETGFGNAKDKWEKNRFAAEKVYHAIKDMKVVGALRKQPGLWEIGVPIGLIAGIVPSTNPTSTVIYKAMISMKAGSPILFSPHPGAVQCTLKTATLLAEAAEQAGCPKGAIGCISTPTMDAVQELMHHPHTRLILATGGGAMVKAAYSSGKPAIGVGAGNGPAYIHKSANIPEAVRQIIQSKTFDNGTICASEQSVMMEACCENAVKEEFRRQGAYFLSSEEGQKVASILLRPNGTMNPAVVGKTAWEIGTMAGITVPVGTPVLVARETEAGPTRPYSREKLCPVLGFFVEQNEDMVLKRAIEILLGEGAGHTFAMHATDEDVIRRFAKEIPASRFLVNTPSSLGGIGATTPLFPALTLGCGAIGGSSSSNNISPMDLINIRRVAWGTEPMEDKSDPVVDRELIEKLTHEILNKLRRNEQ